MAEAATEVFDAIFLQRTDAAGDSVDTPEGANVKRYGASQGAYGIVKQRISPLSTDVESEVAASLLAEVLGMSCCRAWRFGDDAVFSAFEYDFTCEYLVHMRRLFDGPRGENELENLLAVRPPVRRRPLPHDRLRLHHAPGRPTPVEYRRAGD